MIDTPDALPGNVKVTRDDWLREARALLVSQGVQSVKVLTIGDRLGVSRSSFYWYFQSRKDLLEQLLSEWDRRNTGILIRHAALPAADIVEAVGQFFLCVLDPAGFDPQLDFAIREWARRDAEVRQVIDRADTARTEALAAMFARHGFDPPEADIRARVLYYQQIGYYALDLGESLEQRLARVPAYLLAFTGQRPTQTQVDTFIAGARALPAA